MMTDMHTHSVSSHDSVCEIRAMRDAQAARGMAAFAVTDHFDTCSYGDYDVFTPIRQAYDTVQQLNSAPSECRVLMGIEIGESFRCPEIYERVRNLVPYDAVIGSVHLVDFNGKLEAYSKTDFSAFSESGIYDYLDRYFDDLLTMIGFLDFDILAHLTCPLRYITGKYGFPVDLSRFDGKIQRILEEILHRGIALEVNTSCMASLGTLMPPEDVIRRYYHMGGRLVTLGSDAHRAEDAAAHFAEALDILKKIGFETVCRYQNRQPVPIPIK